MFQKIKHELHEHTLDRYFSYSISNVLISDVIVTCYAIDPTQELHQKYTLVEYPYYRDDSFIDFDSRSVLDSIEGDWVNGVVVDQQQLSQKLVPQVYQKYLNRFKFSSVLSRKRFLITSIYFCS